MITISDLTFHGFLSTSNYESLQNFSHPFEFGKVYALKSPLGKGAWALSWIIGGRLQENAGIVQLNEQPYTLQQRRQDAWCVRFDEVKRFKFFRQSIAAQIQHGLRKSSCYSLTFAEIVQRFALTPARLSCPITQLSAEAWRASCAIGVAQGKRIFCFPHLPPTLIQETRHLWFEEMLYQLRSLNALVVIPLAEISENLFNEVIHL